MEWRWLRRMSAWPQARQTSLARPAAQQQPDWLIVDHYALDLAALSVDLVIGANNPHRERLIALAQTRGNTQLHPPRPHLADLMAAADLAIGAGGATTWERCCLGLPSLVISIAKNQRPACEALAKANSIAYRGHKDEASTEQLRCTLQALVTNPHQCRHLSAAGADLVDGRGRERVMSRLFHDAKSL
jgi:spore coat polysaccharide biosynthesis predicted glycosyltransferase SpsG